MDPTAGVTGTNMAAGLGGTALLAGIIWYFIKTSGERERARAETANAAIAKKDEVISSFATRSLDLLEKNVETVKSSQADMDKRISRLEGASPNA